MGDASRAGIEIRKEILKITGVLEGQGLINEMPKGRLLE